MTKDWGFLGFHTALPKKSSLLGSLGGWGCVSSQQTCKIKAQQGDKFFTLILRSFPMLLDHLRRTKRRLRRKKPHGTPWGRAGSGDLSSLQLQQILGRNLQAWPSVALQLPRRWSPPPAGAVSVRALLFPHPVVAGKFKVSWQPAAPLLHPLPCTPALRAYRGFAGPELPATAIRLICAAPRVGAGPPAWGTSPTSPGQPSLCSSSPSCSGIPAWQVWFFFFYAPLSIPCLSPPLLSIPKYIAQWQ